MAKWTLRGIWAIALIIVILLLILRQKSSTAAWIAFASDRSGNYQIYTMRPDGSDVQQITDLDTINTFPDWSPDGDWIIFTGAGNLYSASSEIYRVKRDGTHLERLTYLGRTLLQPMYSPDGSQISFEMQDPDGSRLYLIDADGNGLQQIPGADMRSPAWSPDGQWLAFISARDGEPLVYKINTTSFEIRRLFSGFDVECCLRWEKDWIFFTDRNHSIVRMRDDGTHFNVAVSSNQFVCCAAVSPGYKMIVFTAQHHRSLDIVQSTWAGEHRINLSQTPYHLDCCASWSPTFEHQWRPDIWTFLILLPVMIFGALQVSNRVL